MKHTVRQRLASLRAWMADKGVEAFIVPSTDPHLSEYVAPHWQSREWISGFTGSAGTIVVTRTKAGLWTDSRYFLQASRQLEGTGIELYKEMLPDTPSITSFLRQELEAGDCTGIDGNVFATAKARSLLEELSANNIKLRSLPDPMDCIWTDRPGMPDGQAFVYGTEYAGQIREEKLGILRDEMHRAGVGSMLVTALDEIAWTLNIRGSDVHCNPVVVSYLVIEEDNAHLFVNPQKITHEVAGQLRNAGISLHGYEEVKDFLANMKGSILLDLHKTNFAVYSSISSSCTVVESDSPVGMLKAIRNEHEIAGIHSAMKRDGVAMVRFLKWLEEAVPAGRETELSVERKLRECRAAQPLYMGESFDTIAGYGEHGAIVHYEATEETDAPLQAKGFILLDSGAQYMDGTTDITRTIALGELTDEEKTDYTLVLKGHIALARAVFPEGTRGTQLDVLARMPLWQHRMNFLHGTGHGVGHFLNVHEGPQSIRMNENPVTLRAGMLTSNEPGIYKAGRHGVRIENLVLAVPAGEGMFGNYLRFETVTLCPICKKGIITDMLEREEREWLNDYHNTVYRELTPLLEEAEREWLEEACKAI